MAMAEPWRNRIVGAGTEPPDQLVANPANWRIHPGAQRDALRGSLTEVGWVQQVLVNRRTGFVIDGHARIEEALSRKEPTVPVLYVDLDPEEEALVLATLDPIGAMADRDDARLRALLADVSVDDEGLLALLSDLGDGRPKAGLTDPDEVPPLEETTIKAGDLFALGGHRLLCGDATEAKEMARLMGGMRADCIWTDPPYGVDYVGKTALGLRIANDAVPADELVRDAFSVAREHVAEGAPFYCAGPAGPRSLGYQLALLASGFRLHQELVWVKDVFVLGHSDYHYAHEPIFYGYAPGAGRPGRGRHPGSRWYGGNAASSVLAFDRPRRSEEHPTMKPVDLVAHCLANSTPGGGVVLDPFAGSGTTIIAAEQLDRRCFATDIDPRYVAVSIARWEGFTGRTAERLDG
jgi:DNA modification methylase